MTDYSYSGQPCSASILPFLADRPLPASRGQIRALSQLFWGEPPVSQECCQGNRPQLLNGPHPYIANALPPTAFLFASKRCAVNASNSCKLSNHERCALHADLLKQTWAGKMKQLQTLIRRGRAEPNALFFGISKLKLTFGAVAISLLGITAAPAHVTLKTQQATVGSVYKAVLIVPHGCAGSPMLKLRVQIPNGVIAVKPQPKAGWNVETVSGKYSQTFDYFGTQVSEGVKEIVWSGRLLDEHY